MTSIFPASRRKNDQHFPRIEEKQKRRAFCAVWSGPADVYGATRAYLRWSLCMYMELRERTCAGPYINRYLDVDIDMYVYMELRERTCAGPYINR